MDKNNYPAKKVSLRKQDNMSGRVPGPIPGPSKWIYTEKKAILKHLNMLLTSATYLLSHDISIRSKVITTNKNFPVPMTIKMQDRLIAKSHRPITILSEIESSIISIQELGKLIVGITEAGLESLIELLEEIMPLVPNSIDEWTYIKELSNNDKRLAVIPKYVREYNLIHEFTSIENFYSYSDKDVLCCIGDKELKNASEDGQLKVRFFDYDDSNIDNKLIASFIKKFSSVGITESNLNRLKLPGISNTYLIPYTENIQLKEMAKFPGVEQISSLKRFTSSSNKSVDESTIAIIEPKSDVNYPKIALVDSGISPDNKYLAKWITDRVEFVNSNEQDNYHGDFIGGLLIYGGKVNKGLKKHIETGIKILDVVVLPDDTKSELREDHLINSLIDVLEEYSKEYKVWNLSLNIEAPFSGVISEFTASIDELQNIYDVIFVISAGNYDEMRTEWPTEEMLEDDLDRIFCPADSVRGITVGAIAIDSNQSMLVDKNEVAPYSRRGPGIGLTIKPDVVHYSGNSSNFPIKSIDKQGNILSDCGTSFSTPIVSSVLAEYFNNYPYDLSTCLAKALLVHSSKSPINNKNVSAIKDHYYYGFGVPNKLSDFLYGNENEITLIFEGDINALEGANWIRVADFPFPKSLCADGKIRGEILVTIAYDSHLNPKLGSEYCRSNLDLKLRTEIDGGTYETISKTSSTKGIIAGEKWEKARMTKELKWSPIKQVKFISPKGRAGNSNVILEVFPTWRNLSERQKIHFAIAVTIKDPKAEAPVYNEVTQLLVSSFRYSDIVLNNMPIRLVNR